MKNDDQKVCYVQSRLQGANGTVQEHQGCDLRGSRLWVQLWGLGQTVGPGCGVPGLRLWSCEKQRGTCTWGRGCALKDLGIELPIQVKVFHTDPFIFQVHLVIKSYLVLLLWLNIFMFQMPKYWPL